MSGWRAGGNALQRAIRSFRHEGPRTFGMKLLSELGYRRVYLLARTLTAPIVVWPRGGFDLEILAPGNLEDYAALRADITHDMLARRIRAGHLCFVVREHGRVVSACWSATREAWNDFLGCNILVGTGDVYFYDAYTAASHRGRDLAPLLCAHQLQHFRDAGFVRAVRATVPENAAALRAHAKSGFVPVAVIGRVRVGPWRREFRHPLEKSARGST